MYVSHSTPDGKLDVSDLGRVPFRASLQGCPTRDGVQTPKVSKPTNTGGGDDDGHGGNRAADRPTERCTSTVTMRTGSLTTTTDRNLPVELADGVAERIPHRGRRRPYWRAEWWAQVPISKRGAQLRDTRDGERRDEFDSARTKVDRWRTAGAKVGHRKLTGYPRRRWRAYRTRKSRKPREHDYPAQRRTRVSRKR